MGWVDRWAVCEVYEVWADGWAEGEVYELWADRWAEGWVDGRCVFPDLFCL